VPVLVDTSLWVDYFRGERRSENLDVLIDENLVVTNDLILAELVPFLRIRGLSKLIALLYAVSRLEISIDWDQIVEFQCRCLGNGLNGIGIPDLIIAQNAIQHRCGILTLDGHFVRMKDIIGFDLIS
jgi:predicted nucleic acid-binding protein